MSEKLLPRIAVVLLGGAAFVIVMGGLKSVPGLVGPVFLALVLTVTVHPMRVWLRRHSVPEWLASTIMLLVAYSLIIVLTLALVVSLGRLVVLLPSYTSEVKDNLQQIGDWLDSQGVGQDQVDSMVNQLDLGKLVSLATGVLTSVLDTISSFFFLATLLLFMAFDTTKTTDILAALRERHADMVDALASFALGTRTYMVVSATFGLIVAVIDTAALYLMGVPGAFIWGVLAFVTNFIPNIGFVIGVIPPAVIGLLEGGPDLMLAVILVYSVINFVIQSVIQPRVVGDRVGLTPTITFVSLVFWAWALGALGALLAVPLTILTRALLVEADPDARWALPLISGKLPPHEGGSADAGDTDPAPEPPPEATPGVTAAQPSDA